MADIGTIDWILLGILLLSVLIGLWRGFVFEVMSLLGWVVAYVAAQALTPLVSPHLPVGAPNSGVQSAAGFVLSFVLVLIVWSLLTRLVRMLVSASPLSLVDRVLGAGFGLLRGLVLLLVLATLVAMTPAARSPGWRESRGAAWLGALLHELKPMLPAAVAQHLPA